MTATTCPCGHAADHATEHGCPHGCPWIACNPFERSTPNAIADLTRRVKALEDGAAGEAPRSAGMTWNTDTQELTSAPLKSRDEAHLREKIEALKRHAAKLEASGTLLNRLWDDAKSERDQLRVELKAVTTEREDHTAALRSLHISEDEAREMCVIHDVPLVLVNRTPATIACPLCQWEMRGKAEAELSNVTAERDAADARMLRERQQSNETLAQFHAKITSTREDAANARQVQAGLKAELARALADTARYAKLDALIEEFRAPLKGDHHE